MTFFLKSHVFQRIVFETNLTLNFRFRSWSVVFFGSDNYSLPGLKELCKYVENKKVKHLEVVTVNNSSPVYDFATRCGIKVHIWPPVLNECYDFGIIVSFGKFIPKKILDLFPLGIFNVHASLLPRWRGGMPIVHALKNGDTVTGVSVIKIKSDKFDTGDIILTRPVSIGKNEMLPSLHNKLSKLGSECLSEIINDMPECHSKVVSQSNEGVTYAPKLKKELSSVKWNEMTAQEIYNLYRAFYGMYDLRTTWQGTAVKLICFSLNECDDGIDKKPGTILYSSNNQFLIVQCKEKSLQVCTIKLKGKLYSAKNFSKGYLEQIPKKLWQFGS